MSRFHHVANGTSTTGTIQLAGIGGTCSIWADALHEGPVPGDLADAELIQVRARYFAQGADDSPEDLAAEVVGWRSAIDGAACDEIVLWYEHDLFDQLDLIQLLTYIASSKPAAPVSLICIGSFPGRPSFKGLGELTPDELRPLLDVRAPVSDEQFDLASRAWAAFRSPDPTAIVRLLDRGTSPLPFLAAALHRHLEEFPWAQDGLSRTERRLMDLVRDPAGIHETFPRMHDLESAFYIADSSWWGIVERLAFASPALLDLNLRGPVDLDRGLPHGTIALTAAGLAVLEGRGDRVRLCGIDQWLGGVHLTGRGPVWRWRAGELVVA